MKTSTNRKFWCMMMLLLGSLSLYSQDSLTLKPCDAGQDAYVRSGPNSQDNNFGSDFFLASATVNSGDETESYRSYLFFDLSAVPVGSTILSAQLNLWHLPELGHSGSQNDTELRIVDGAWSENTITWNNQPTANTVFTVLPQSTSATQDYNVDVTNLVQNWIDGAFLNFGIRLQLEEEGTPVNFLTFTSGEYENEDFCPELVIFFSPPGSDPECDNESRNISTGYDNVANSVIPPQSQDDDWILTMAPLTATGVTVGDPAFAIETFSSWDDLTGASYISAYDFPNFSENNADGNPYRFTNCFCLAEETEINYDLEVYVDNAVRIGLLEQSGTYHLIGDINTNDTDHFTFPPAPFTGNLVLPAGKHCLIADLRNLSGVAMGLEIEGTINGIGIGESICCGPTGIINGAKYLDVNCNGSYDFENGANDNDQYLPGWTIELYDAAGNLVQSTVTDQFGYYQFIGVPPGTYTVSEVQQSGYVQSEPASGSYTVTIPDQDGIVIDNLNFGNCEVNCGAVVQDSLSESCALDGTYEYFFSLENLSAYNVTSVIFQSGPEFQWPGSNDPGFGYWQVNIPSMGTSGPFPGPVIIDPGFPITQPTEFCFDVLYFSEEYECCHFEHCVVLEPQDPCDDVSVVSEEIDSNEDGCCHELSFTNDFCEDYFVGISTEIITPGVTFGNTDGGGIWNVSGTDVSLVWEMAQMPTIPLGTTTGMTFCLENINSFNQTPQQVVVSWLAVDDDGTVTAVCTDTLEFFCEPCALVNEPELVCNSDGTLDFTFSVTNNTDPAHFSGQIVLEMIDPAGLPLSQNIFNVPLNSGQTSPPLTTTVLSPPPAGTDILYKVILYDLNGEDPLWCCHADTFSITVPDCGMMECIDEDLIDPTIDCSTIFEPVCGCDNVTYENACVAEFYNGVTSWTPGPCDGPTSVEANAALISNSIVEVTWDILGLSNVQHYLVLHGPSPQQLQVIDMVPHLPGNANYVVLHDEPIMGEQNYYQVTALLDNGEMVQSNVTDLFIDGPQVEPTVLLSPNPVGSQFTLAWTNLPESDFQLIVLSWGQPVYQQYISGHEGVIDIQSGNWPPGVYELLIINDKGFRLHDKLVKMQR